MDSVNAPLVRAGMASNSRDGANGEAGQGSLLKETALPRYPLPQRTLEVGVTGQGDEWGLDRARGGWWARREEGSRGE